MYAYICGAWRAATCREVTSFEFHIATKNLCCITDVMNEINWHHITWLEKWMCIFVRHDELRRAVTSFEFCIVVKNICLITNVMIEIFSRHITTRPKTWMYTFVRHDELRHVATCCGELWLLYFDGKYMLLCRCNDWKFSRQFTWLETWMFTFVRHGEVRRAVTSCKFHIAVKNICCSTDVMVENFVVNLHDWKHGCVHSCGMANCDVLRRVVTCCD
jgi:hypothetical protein